MRTYKGFDLSGLTGYPSRTSSIKLREGLKEIDEFLRQLSRWTSTNAASDISSVSGIVNSIATNGGPKRTGNLTFTSTSDINVINSANDHKWFIGTLPATVFGTILDLDAAAVHSDGSGNAAARANHVHAIASGPQTGFYGTAASTGAGSNLLRASAVLVYPEALGTASDRTKTLSLTDDATEGALFTSAAGFSASSLALKAPNATNTLRVGKWGNIALGGNATLSDLNLIAFNKQNFSDPAEIVGYTGGIRQQGTGGMCGFRLNADLGASSANANRVLGIDLITKQSTTSSTGEQVCLALLYTSTSVSAVSRGDQKGLRINAGPFLNVTYANNFGIQMQKPTSNNWGTVTNNYWIYMEALTGGTNRYGLWMDPITTGSPTIATGVKIGLHTVGTTRRAFQGGNSFLCDSGDFICDAAAKGPICKDGQGTPHYWRFTVGSDGTPAIIDIGTTAPTT